jgi:hypothetical protein
MSWEDLETPAVDIRDVMQQREDTARLCFRVFATEDGQKFLAWLQDRYVNVPIAVPGTDPSHAFFAEGQRTVVRDIEAWINQARKL